MGRAGGRKRSYENHNRWQKKAGEGGCYQGKTAKNGRCHCGDLCRNGQQSDMNHIPMIGGHRTGDGMVDCLSDAAEQAVIVADGCDAITGRTGAYADDQA